MELSIVMPCLNEAETLASCIRQAKAFLADHHIDGEVIIADNGSADGSREIARSEGARVVEIQERGYGSALTGGIHAASGTFVAMGDADDSYDFGSLMPFLEKLREGHDLVMGNRFAGGIQPGAMPFHHRYIGNPVLSFLGRLFFRTKVRDFHCGLRAFKRESIVKLDLRTTGMEFASEMVVRASMEGLSIAEVPTPLRKDGRSRPPHLRSFRDGWRHLRFLLLYSPRWLFMYPGLVLLVAGLVASAFLTAGPVTFGSVTFDIATLLYAHATTVIGFQALLFAVLSRVFAVRAGLLPASAGTSMVERLITPERTIGLGALLAVVGFVASTASINYWRARGFGDLSPESAIRAASPGVLGLVLGMQLSLGGLFLGILRIGVK